MNNGKVGCPGWPREFLTRDTGATEPATGELVCVKTPNIFVGGTNQIEGDWLMFEEDLSVQAFNEHLCVVCGLTLGRTIVLGHTGTRRTDGPPCHPRCFALALRFCPRFSDSPYTRPKQIVAYVYDGPRWGWTYAALIPEDLQMCKVKRSARGFTRDRCKTLAKADPLGAGSLLDFLAQHP